MLIFVDGKILTPLLYQKTNDPNDLSGPQLGAGLNNKPELSAFEARKPYVPAAETIKNMEAPLVSDIFHPKNQYGAEYRLVGCTTESRGVEEEGCRIEQVVERRMILGKAL